jgi:glutathione S-transferase
VPETSKGVTLFIWPEADGLASSSPYCLKVLYALKFLGIPHKVEYAIHQLPSWMQRGKLPVAEIGTAGIEDSSNILRTLDSLIGTTHRLYPLDPSQRADTVLLEDWADETLTPYLVYYRWAVPTHFSKFFPQAFRFVPEDIRGRAADAALEFHMQLFRERGMAYATEDERQEYLGAALDILEQRLQQRDFLVGETPSAADFAAFPPLQIAVQARISELVPGISARNAVVRWMKKMNEFTQ